MSHSASEYTIQEASAKLGVPVQKLRRWDAQGVLVARRTEGGHRRYSREIIDGLAGSTLGQPMDSYEDQLATARKSLREKRRIIQLLLESESRYRDLVETSHDLIWSTDAQGRFTYLNNGAFDLLGIPPKDLLGRCFFDFEARPSHISNRRFFSTLRKSGEVKNHIAHLLAGDGSDRWIGINARVQHDEAGQICGIRGTARNVTEQHEAALQIEYLATHDSLTGLPNRVSLQRALEQALASGDVGAVLFIDIDHFKYVNDNFGHRSGDQLIVGVSGVLKEAVKQFNGQVFRLGGDEYAVHLPESLRGNATKVGDHLLESLRHYRFQSAGHQRMSSLTASVGIALYPFHGSDVAGLLSNADIAMYQAKDGGRNRYVLYDQDAQSLRRTHSRVQWANRLRDVLDDDRLVLYYQPVVRLSDLRTVHCEILVRLRDDSGNLILPSQFIEYAESLGMVQEIDMRVVDRLLEYLRAPETRNARLRYFVNLSRVSISDQHWVRKFHNMLAGSDVSHSQLVFEITETAAMSDVDVTQQFIRELKQMGCRFALDDFGAGFSSFYYLKRFDVDYLKIDGGFVRDLATDEGNRIFVKALCDVARGLNKQVVAEWVENRETLQILNEMGTLYGQGYLFQRPMPLWEEVPERIVLASGEPAASLLTEKDIPGHGGLREAQ
jgi:diguanylate cyclase (GGDEF)-like protein/PAS domain S-box-containing protein/excisionase family DNA binding protein